jgi:hypothetical protein
MGTIEAIGAAFGKEMLTIRQAQEMTKAVKHAVAYVPAVASTMNASFSLEITHASVNGRIDAPATKQLT